MALPDAETETRNLFYRQHPVRRSVLFSMITLQLKCYCSATAKRWGSQQQIMHGICEFSSSLTQKPCEPFHTPCHLQNMLSAMQRKACHRLAVPSRCIRPTTLYRLLKKVNQSSSTFFSLSGRSSHSVTQSSDLREDWARARLGSFPANTSGHGRVRLQP